MKTFKQLSANQKKCAIDREFDEILEAICKGYLRFDDENRALQRRIDRAAAAAEKNQTPWFTVEYLVEDKVIRDAIRGMAKAEAEDALYSEPGQRVVTEPSDGSES